jgi:hypothetical protein
MARLTEFHRQHTWLSASNPCAPRIDKNLGVTSLWKRCRSVCLRIEGCYMFQPSTSKDDKKRKENENVWEHDKWGPLMASGTLTNCVIMPSNPYFQFLQPNTKWVGSIPKIKSATKQRDGFNPTQKTGLDPTQPSQPSTKHTLGTCGADTTSACDAPLSTCIGKHNYTHMLDVGNWNMEQMNIIIVGCLSLP